MQIYLESILPRLKAQASNLETLTASQLERFISHVRLCSNERVNAKTSTLLSNYLQSGYNALTAKMGRDYVAATKAALDGFTVSWPKHYLTRS